MKLIGMRFKGIGPYEQEYSIDFAALNRSHMFLIEGETGAGKSTILDCISFALYGDVSVDAASKDRLRSRFLGTEQTPSYVDLIFELNDAFYRVRREPAFERRKLRGNGTVSVNAKGLLWQVDDGLAALLPSASDELDGTATRYFDYADDADHATQLASQARDTGAEILRLLHLTRDQFSKTVMLAQGQFSGFLRCKPEERTQLIKSLFEADVYESIQKTLDEMRKAQSDQVAAQRRDVVAAIRDARGNAEAIERRAHDVDAEKDVARIDLDEFDFESEGLDLESASFDFDKTDDISGARANAERDSVDPLDAIRANWCLTDDGDLAEPAMSPSDIAATLDRHLNDVATASTELLEHSHAALTAATTRLDDEQRKLDAMRRLSDANKEYRNVADRRETLERRRQSIDGMRDRLRDSASAEPVARAQRELAAVQGRRAKSDIELSKARMELDACESMNDLTAAREKENAVATGLSAAEADLRAAKELGTRAAAARTAWRKADHSRRQMQSCAGSAESARAALRELEHEATEADLRRQLEDVIRREAAQSGLQDRLQAARTVLDHARKRQEEQSRLADLQTAVEQTAQKQREADDAYTQARRAFFAAGAARLASELAEGQPCPVCGSVDHPHPAVTQDGRNDHDDAAETETVAAARANMDVVPDEARLNQLDQAARRAAQQVVEAESAVAVCQTRIDAETEQSQGLNVEDAEGAVAQVRKELDGMRELGKERARLEAQLQKLHDAGERAAECEHRADVARAETAGALELVRAAVKSCAAETSAKSAAAVSESGAAVSADASDESGIADELATLAEHIDTVAARAVADERAANDAIAVCERAAREVSRIDQKITRRNALEQRVGELAAVLQEIDRQLSAASTACDEALAQSGFGDIETALTACLDAAAAARLQSEIERFDRDDHATQAEVQRTLDALRTQLTSDIVRSVLAQYTADDDETGIGSISADGRGSSDGDVSGNDVSGGDTAVAGDAAQSATTSTRQSYQSTNASLKSAPNPDRLNAIVRDLETVVRRAEADRDAAIRAEEQDENLDAERERVAKTLRSALDLWVSSSARFVPVRDMALLAGGRAGSLATGTANEGLSLVTYAVTERFRDVLDCANEILRDIKGGVYELRLGAHEGRTAKTGLPIEVFDRRSDLACEATTLSGGETFFVSLALALALADIIQAENGGISMDTLFIDEGFGSLSEEYLDDVLDVLRAMSRHRDIGVISHVGQLKDQIAERISVTRISEDSASRLTVTV
ncbi:AAA family ATPase [Bifidobacterium vansinderenii]|uniref:Nuclease SbcCD subunit C n=1 Tax=Bifidobacterium vansinderenii TaxID=1984871 RepID=A0A229VW32_9BIFI|nr:AAA family ATPase [Bifidobacterium vansinderenii]OXM99619.1 AAA domain-containing protein [Bifidobacterium vansinderenii]